MADIETLTEEEREQLGEANSKYDLGCKALRIIDALTEALSAAEQGEARHFEAAQEWEHLCGAAEARVRELETKLSAAKVSAEDKAVLDAMAEFSEADLKGPLDAPPPSQRQHAWRILVKLCRAELARREAKRAP